VACLRLHGCLAVRVGFIRAGESLSATHNFGMRTNDKSGDDQAGAYLTARARGSRVAIPAEDLHSTHFDRAA